MPQTFCCLQVVEAEPATLHAILPMPVSALFAVTQVPTAVPQTFCCLRVADPEPFIFPTEFESEPVAVSVLVVIVAWPATVEAILPIPVRALFAVTQVPAAVPQTFCCLQVTEAELATAQDILPTPVKALFAVVQVPTAVPQTFCCFSVAEPAPFIFPTELLSEPVAVSVLEVIVATPAEAPASEPEPFS